MFKKILSILTALSMIMSYMTVMVKAEEKTMEEKGFGYEKKIKSVIPLKHFDFEKYNLGSNSQMGFDYSTGSVYPQVSHDGSTAIATDGEAKLQFYLDNPLTSGIYLLSFDMKQNDGELFFLRGNFPNSNGTLWSTMFGLHNGLAGQVDGWTVKEGAKITPEEWFHVSIFIDFDKDVVYYYVNNEFVSKNGGVQDLYSVCFCGNRVSGTERCFDNVAMFEFNDKLQTELNELGIAMPEEYSGDVTLAVSSKYYGNVFTSFDEVELKIDIKSNFDYNVTADIDFTVKNYSGETVWTDTQNK